VVGAVQFNKLKTFFTAILDATPQDERADARETAALAYASNGLFTGAEFDGSRRPSKSMRSSIFSGDLSAAAAAMQSGVRSVKKKTVASLLKEHGYVFKRGKKHYIFERTRNGKRQVFTQASTPSSKYSITKQLAELDRQQKEAEAIAKQIGDELGENSSGGVLRLRTSQAGPSEPSTAPVPPSKGKGKKGKKR